MKYMKGFKFRIYPNQEQRQIIHQTLNGARVVYNHFRAIRRKGWGSYNKSSRMLTRLKCNSDFAWLKSGDSTALVQALRILEMDLQKYEKKEGSFPKFHSPNHFPKSYRTSAARIFDGNIKLPKVGIVKTKLSREVKGRIVNTTVICTASGKYFVSLCVETDVNELLENKNGHQVGIDVGLKNFYTDNQGNKVSIPSALKKLKRKLRRLYNQLDRKEKGSQNYRKTEIKLAKIYERIENIRKDFLHKESTRLVRKNQLIGIEDLQIKSMMKDQCFRKAISFAHWDEFFRLLEYKSKLYGCDVVKVDTFYPSSQLCSVCGYKNVKTKNLDLREWTCPQCYTHHDRDINAAKNILHKAVEMKKSV